MSVRGLAAHEHRRLAVLARPRNLLTAIAAATHTTRHDVVVRTVHHRLRVVHQLQLLGTFLFQRAEILLMGRAEMCEHAYRRLYDVAQTLHLTSLTDAGLEESHAGMLVEQPD